MNRKKHKPNGNKEVDLHYVLGDWQQFGDTGRIKSSKELGIKLLDSSGIRLPV